MIPFKASLGPVWRLNRIDKGLYHSDPPESRWQTRQAIVPAVGAPRLSSAVPVAGNCLCIAAGKAGAVGADGRAALQHASSAVQPGGAARGGRLATAAVSALTAILNLQAGWVHALAAAVDMNTHVWLQVSHWPSCHA